MVNIIKDCKNLPDCLQSEKIINPIQIIRRYLNTLRFEMDKICLELSQPLPPIRIYYSIGRTYTSWDSIIVKMLLVQLGIFYYAKYNNEQR